MILAFIFGEVRRVRRHGHSFVVAEVGLRITLPVEEIYVLGVGSGSLCSLFGVLFFGVVMVGEERGM